MPAASFPESVPCPCRPLKPPVPPRKVRWPEYVNPVALGRIRAKQDRAGDTEREKGMALLIHGDAAFADYLILLGYSYRF